MHRIETIDQLRDNIKASLEAQHEQAFMAAKENAALGKLIDDCEVEVEESDIEKRCNNNFNISVWNLLVKECN